MAHDPNHSNGQLPARRTFIDRPSAAPTLSEAEILQRAARHIRLRTIGSAVRTTAFNLADGPHSGPYITAPSGGDDVP